ncbi:MAG: hypothetical protein QXE80_09155 [Pyrobaculum sp.]
MEFRNEVTQLLEVLKSDHSRVLELIAQPENFAFQEPWIIEPRDRLKSEHKSFGKQYKFGVNPNTFVSEKFPLIYVPRGKKKRIEIVPAQANFCVVNANQTYEFLMRDSKTGQQTHLTITFDQSLQVSKLSCQLMSREKFLQDAHSTKLTAYYVDNLLFFAKISRCFLPSKIVLFHDFQTYVEILEKTSLLLFEEIESCWKLSELF